MADLMPYILQWAKMDSHTNPKIRHDFYVNLADIFKENPAKLDIRVNEFIIDLFLACSTGIEREILNKSLFPKRGTTNRIDFDKIKSIGKKIHEKYTAQNSKKESSKQSVDTIIKSMKKDNEFGEDSSKSVRQITRYYKDYLKYISPSNE